MQWHHSGTRRDACALLYAAGELHGQALKTRLERRYDVRIDPKRFYGVLRSLVEAGHVEKREQGIHDAYALTARGEEALLAHYEWLGARIEDGEGTVSGGE